MARGPSADPAVRLSISLPKSVHELAKIRAAQFRLKLSEYIQHLVSTDGVERPPTLKNYDITTGTAQTITAHVEHEAVQKLRAEALEDSRNVLPTETKAVPHKPQGQPRSCKPRKQSPLE